MNIVQGYHRRRISQDKLHAEERRGQEMQTQARQARARQPLCCARTRAGSAQRSGAIQQAEGAGAEPPHCRP